MTRKSVCMLLICGILLSLSGCVKETVLENNDTVQEETTATVEEETRDPMLDDLGEFDFDGYEYRVQSVTYDPNGTFPLFDTEANGEVLNDSLYQRNLEIEERFNIVFVASEDSYSNNFASIKSTVAAGEDAYDMIMLINREAFSAALDGYLMPVSKLVHLNLEKDYYLHDINDQLTINGKSFFVYSEESVYTFERAGILLFNKQIASANGLDDYYDMVNAGTWTLDRFYGDAQTVLQDLDGNGIYDANDQYGIIGAADYLFASIYNGTGELTIAKDENDIPYFSAMTSERFATVIEGILNQLNGGKHIFINDNSDYAGANQMFLEGQSLFLGTVVGRIFALREMEEDFGILPYPKMDESQQNYVTRAVDAWLHVVPVTNPDPERTSVIMETLASGSARYVFPAYYEKALSQKVLRDEESADMLDLIRVTRVIDLGECPWYETVRLRYSRDLLFKQSVNLASLNASIQKQVDALIEKVIAYTESME